MLFTIYNIADIYNNETLTIRVSYNIMSIYFSWLSMEFHIPHISIWFLTENDFGAQEKLGSREPDWYHWLLPIRKWYSEGEPRNLHNWWLWVTIQQ